MALAAGHKADGPDGHHALPGSYECERFALVKAHVLMEADGSARFGKRFDHMTDLS